MLLVYFLRPETECSSYEQVEEKVTLFGGPNPYVLQNIGMTYG